MVVSFTLTAAGSLDSLDLLRTASPIPGHQTPMEPTDTLSGGHSRSGDYGLPAATFNQLEQGEDQMWLLIMRCL
jgi:hypothetical protein